MRERESRARQKKQQEQEQEQQSARQRLFEGRDVQKAREQQRTAAGSGLNNPAAARGREARRGVADVREIMSQNVTVS